MALRKRVVDELMIALYKLHNLPGFSVARTCGLRFVSWERLGRAVTGIVMLMNSVVSLPEWNGDPTSVY